MLLKRQLIIFLFLVLAGCSSPGLKHNAAGIQGVANTPVAVKMEKIRTHRCTVKAEFDELYESVAQEYGHDGEDAKFWGKKIIEERLYGLLEKCPGVAVRRSLSNWAQDFSDYREKELQVKSADQQYQKAMIRCMGSERPDGEAIFAMKSAFKIFKLVHIKDRTHGEKWLLILDEARRKETKSDFDKKLRSNPTFKRLSLLERTHLWGAFALWYRRGKKEWQPMLGVGVNLEKVSDLIPHVTDGNLAVMAGYNFKSKSVGFAVDYSNELVSFLNGDVSTEWGTGWPLLGYGQAKIQWTDYTQSHHGGGGGIGYWVVWSSLLLDAPREIRSWLHAQKLAKDHGYIAKIMETGVGDWMAAALETEAVRKDLAVAKKIYLADRDKYFPELKAVGWGFPIWYQRVVVWQAFKYQVLCFVNDYKARQLKEKGGE